MINPEKGQDEEVGGTSQSLISRGRRRRGAEYQKHAEKHEAAARTQRGQKSISTDHLVFLSGVCKAEGNSWTDPQLGSCQVSPGKIQSFILPLGTSTKIVCGVYSE